MNRDKSPAGFDCGAASHMGMQFIVGNFGKKSNKLRFPSERLPSDPGSGSPLIPPPPGAPPFLDSFEQTRNWVPHSSPVLGRVGIRDADTLAKRAHTFRQSPCCPPTKTARSYAQGRLRVGHPADERGWNAHICQTRTDVGHRAQLLDPLGSSAGD